MHSAKYIQAGVSLLLFNGVIIAIQDLQGYQMY